MSAKSKSMRVLVPVCETCGFEESRTIDVPALQARLVTLKSNVAALELLVSVVPEEDPPDSYRRTTLANLMNKAKKDQAEIEHLLAFAK